MVADENTGDIRLRRPARSGRVLGAGVRLPEGKVAKNRVHLDIHVDADRKAAEVERSVRN
ncbi:hypothetical protein [Nonomuraea sp. SYSU D8015]|uniref:hypothetical protein n=1 Tax=Nonomuraea sp. SYSU D8015 TaxID=2593644 RepID=UPI001CB6CF43|nr:hypothetical protein [Nonomuraea sp. SYSU D8015]